MLPLTSGNGASNRAFIGWDGSWYERIGVNRLRRRLSSRAGWLAAAILIGWAGVDPWSVMAQTSGLVSGPNRTAEYNAEWVESSSPVRGGGIVATTHFPNSGNTVTSIREPLESLSAQRLQMSGSTPLGSAGAVAPAQAAPNYAAIPNGSGGYLVPTVQYVPMNSGQVAAGNPVQLASAQYPYVACANCQTPMLTQPTAFQPGLAPQPFASQPPVLPPTAGGVYGPIQPQLANPAMSGFYTQPQAQAAPAGGRSGYRSLIPRSLPAGTYIGQGWLGQPKAYVNSQPFRNFMRYLIVP